MRFRERRVQLQSPLCQGAGDGRGLAQGRHGQGGPAKEIVGVEGVGQCVLRIERDGLLVEFLGLLHRLRRYLPVEVLGLQEGFVGGKLGCVTWLRRSAVGDSLTWSAPEMAAEISSCTANTSAISRS